MPLYIEENFTHILRDKLRTGELDAIIIALPFAEADVLTKPLYDEPFYVLLPANHPWTAKTIDSELLNDKSLLLLGEGHCFRDQVLEACPTLRKGGEDSAKHTTVESSSLETIRHMVASGLGVSILPFSAVDSHHYAPGVIEIRPLTRRCRSAPSPSPGAPASRAREPSRYWPTPSACARWPARSRHRPNRNRHDRALSGSRHRAQGRR